MKLRIVIIEKLESVENLRLNSYDRPEKIYDHMIVTMNWIYHVYKHLNKITTQRHHLQKIKVIFKDMCNGELKITQNTYFLDCDTDYEGLIYFTINIFMIA